MDSLILLRPRGLSQHEILTAYSNGCDAAAADRTVTGCNWVNLLLHFGVAADSCQLKQAQVLICFHSPAAHQNHILTMEVAPIHQNLGMVC